LAFIAGTQTEVVALVFTIVIVLGVGGAGCEELVVVLVVFVVSDVFDSVVFEPVVFELVVFVPVVFDPVVFVPVVFDPVVFVFVVFSLAELSLVEFEFAPVLCNILFSADPMTE